MERVQLIDVIGEWEGSAFQKWAYNYMSKNLWRVAYYWGDMDDCMQEAAIEFLLMKRDYQAKVNSAKQFMCLYQLCLRSHVNNVSVKDSRNRSALALLTKADMEPASASDANITVLLNEASSELKEALSLMFNAPQEIMEMLRSDCRRGTSSKQFFNKVLAYMGIGADKAFSLQKELTDLLS